MLKQLFVTQFFSQLAESSWINKQPIRADAAAALFSDNMNDTISKANVAINPFYIYLFNCSALAGIAWARSSSWREPLLSRGAGWAEREGRRRSGPGLECSIEVWCFDGKLCECWAKLQQQWQREGPGTATSLGERKTLQKGQWRTLPGERCCQLTLLRNLPQLKQKETGNNKKLDRVKLNTGMHFRLFSVPFRTDGGEKKPKRKVVAVVNCTVTCRDYGLFVPRKRATQVTAQVLLRLGEEWTV